MQAIMESEIVLLPLHAYVARESLRACADFSSTLTADKLLDEACQQSICKTLGTVTQTLRNSHRTVRVLAVAVML